MIFRSKVRKNSWAKCNVPVEIALGEAIAAELELWRMNVGKISVEDPERVEISDVMTSHLVCADQ